MARTLVAVAIALMLIPLTARAESQPDSRSETEKNREREGLLYDLSIEMVKIPAGKFIMGSPLGEGGVKDYDEQPQHEVYVDSFYMSKYEVRFEQYDIFSKKKPRIKASDSIRGFVGWGRGKRPVINVSWYDAVAFCKWLSETTGDKYRLPTEAEWEYACRAGTTTAYSFGDSVDDLDLYAWHTGNSGEKSHPVGTLKPNAWGLYDMHGNVWEWRSDWYGSSYYKISPPENPPGLTNSQYRARRGGSYYDMSSSDARSANRYGYGKPHDKFPTQGFRFVREVDVDAKPSDGPKGAAREELVRLSIPFTQEEFLNRAKQGDAAAVDLFLSAGMYYDAKDENRTTALMWAAKQGKADTVKILLDGRAGVTKMDADRQTALHLAAQWGHADVVALLIEKGADPTAKNKAGDTPYELAVQAGHADVVKIFSDMGLGVEEEYAAQPAPSVTVQTGRTGSSPLEKAIREGQADAVQTLLNEGADPNMKASYGTTALTYAAQRAPKEIVQMLLDAGGDIHAMDGDGHTPLMRATHEGQTEIVKLLLDRGADVNRQRESGATALMTAASKGHTDIVKALLENGADINIEDDKGHTALTAAFRKKAILSLLYEAGGRSEQGLTPLMEAATKGDADSVRILLSEGADISAKNEYDNTALDGAAAYGHADIVKLLLDKGADPNAKSRGGWTPLKRAALEGHADVVKVLLDKGADMNVRDSDGRTPLLSAALEGHAEVVTVLLEKGVRPSGITLIKAVEGRHADVVRILLENGVDPNTKYKGLTALYYAKAGRHAEIIRLLEAAGGKWQGSQ